MNRSVLVRDDSALSKPSTKRGKLQRAALGLLLEHERAGSLPTSGRFLFYEAAQRGIVSKKRDRSEGRRSDDQDFSDAVMHLREMGVVPWEWIVDETRRLTEWAYASTVQEGALQFAERARIDCWDGEPPPLVLCESRSLAGVLERVASDYLCPIAPTNGQCGGFLVTEVAPVLRVPRLVLYLGDYDWQGGQIETNTRRRLSG